MKANIALATLCLATICGIAPAFSADDATFTKAPQVADSGARPDCAKFKLTDAQKESMFQLHNKLKDELGSKKVALDASKRKMKDLLTQPTIDKAAIQAEQQKVTSLQTDISNSLTSFRIASAEILTPEQRQVMRYKHGHHSRHMRRGPRSSFKPSFQSRPATDAKA